MGASSQTAATTRALYDAELIASSGAWAKEARLSASKRAQSQGLPQRRDEYWKYTRPDVFVASSVAIEAQIRPEIGLFTDQAKTEIAFENGILAVEISARGWQSARSRVSRMRPTLDLHWVAGCLRQARAGGAKPG